MFKKTKKIKELESLVEYYKGLVEGLERRISQVVDQNERLMNRFMATDFKTLQTFTLPEKLDLQEFAYDQFTDDEVAGEILNG